VGTSTQRDILQFSFMFQIPIQLFLKEEIITDSCLFVCKSRVNLRRYAKHL